MAAYSLLKDRFVLTRPTAVDVAGDLLDAIEEQIKTTPPAANKDALPWLKLAVFGCQPSPKGCYRHDVNVKMLYGIEADYDNGHSTADPAAHAGRTIEWAQARLAKIGVHALLYSTASSTPEAPRWRVLADLAQPITGTTAEIRAARRVLMARLNHALGGCLTHESFALSQCYYFGPLVGKPIEVLRTDGARMDEHDGLAELYPAGYGGATSEPDVGYLAPPEQDPPQLYVDGAKAYLKKAATRPISRFEVAAALVRNFGLTDATAQRLWERSGARTDPEHSDRSLVDMLAGARERGKGAYGEGVASPGGPFVRISSVPDWEKIAMAVAIPNAPIWKDDPFGAPPDDAFLGIDPSKPVWPPKTAIKHAQFMFARLSEYRDAPPIVFWDPQNKMIPRSPDGTIVLVYAAYAQMKSFITQSLLMGFVQNTEDAIVAYATGEGAHDVGKNRLPAQVAVRKMDWDEVDERFFLIQGVPQLKSDENVTEFIELLHMLPQKPTIISIDTLQNAAFGIDENTSEFGGLMTDNGPVGRIKRAFPGCTIIVVHHEGKNGAKGQRGHSGTDGAVDAELKVICNEEVGVIQVFLNKLKMGAASKRSTFWQLDKSHDGMPVPMQCTSAEFLDLGGKVSNGKEEDDDDVKSEAGKWRDLVRRTIDDVRGEVCANEEERAKANGVAELMPHQREFVFLDFEHGKNDTDMATMILAARGRMQPSGLGKALDQWKILRDQTRKALTDARRSKMAVGRLGSAGSFINEKGKADEEWRWHLPGSTTAPATIFVKPVATSAFDVFKEEVFAQ